MKLYVVIFAFDSDKVFKIKRKRVEDAVNRYSMFSVFFGNGTFPFFITNLEALNV